MCIVILSNSFEEKTAVRLHISAVPTGWTKNQRGTADSTSRRETNASGGTCRASRENGGVSQRQSNEAERDSNQGEAACRPNDAYVEAIRQTSRHSYQCT